MKTIDILNILKSEKEDKPIYFLNGLIVPLNDWDSYRGKYDHVTIPYVAYEYKSYDLSGYITKVGQFVDLIKSMENNTMYGWKGGEFTVDFNLPIFLSNYGVCTEMYISKIDISEYRIDVVLSKYE